MKKTYFCLPYQWMNYVYHPITIEAMQSMMHNMTIKDSCRAENGIALLLRFRGHDGMKNDPEYPIHDKIILIGSQYGGLTVQVADMEKDRLPGYPLPEIGGITL